jgi:zinc transporter ZupT
MWALVAVVCALAALVGYVLLDGASPRTVATVLAFAGGAVLMESRSDPGAHAREPPGGPP